MFLSQIIYNEHEKKKGEKFIGIIIGACVAGFLLLVAVFVFVVLYAKKHKKKPHKDHEDTIDKAIKKSKGKDEK